MAVSENVVPFPLATEHCGRSRDDVRRQAAADDASADLHSLRTLRTPTRDDARDLENARLLLDRPAVSDNQRGVHLTLEKIEEPDWLGVTDACRKGERELLDAGACAIGHRVINGEAGLSRDQIEAM